MRSGARWVVATMMIVLPSALRAQQYEWVLPDGYASRDVAVQSNGDVYFGGSATGALEQSVYKLLNPNDPDDGVTTSTISGSAEVRRVAVDTSGNVYAVGTFQGTVDFNPGVGVFQMMVTPGIVAETFILKLDSSLGFVWAKELNGVVASAYVQPFSIEVRAGNVYIGGNWGFDATVDFNPGPDFHNLTANGYDSFILKLDTAGNFVWVVGQQAGVTPDRVESLAVDSSGNVYAFGEGGILPALSMLIWKLNSSGNLLWTYGPIANTAGEDSATAIGLDADNNVFVVGSFRGTVLFAGSPTIGRLTSVGPAPGSIDAFVLKITSNGTFVWVRQLGGTQADVARGVVVDERGSAYVVGKFAGTADFNPGTAVHNLTSSAAVDAFITKLTNAGNFVWAGRVGGTGSDDAFDVAVNGTGGIYITGVFTAGTDIDPGPGVVTIEPGLGVVVEHFLLRLRRIGAGTVPDGDAVPGVPLRIGKSGGLLALSWGVSCSSLDVDYEVYEGVLGTYTSHVPVACSTAGLTSASITPASGNRFYLVVAATASFEGSYGVNSSSVERPASGGACLPQLSAGDCPTGSP